MPRLTCAHCGLPVTARREVDGQAFCCYGCYLVSRIVGGGDQQGPRAWSILRLSIGALLAMNVMMIALLLYTGAVEPAAVPYFRWAMFLLATPAMALLVYPFLAGALDEAARKQFSLDTLIAAGALASFAVSAVNTMRGSGPLYFDTATMLPTLVTFGRLIEAATKARTGRLVRGLQALLPRTCLRIEAGGVREIGIDLLRIADRVRVRPGERIPADGRIVEGHALIQEADFTGESEPRHCGIGDRVIAGTVNSANAIVIECECVGEDILLRRIIERVEEAREIAAPWERTAARFARLFIPFVLTLAATAGLFWLCVDGPAKAGFAVLAVLVVACPCAMGIATPVATALAIGRAARSGVLVRGGDTLERIASIDTAFFDKTGTVTTSHPALQRVEALDSSVGEDELLGCLAALEAGSEHPLAHAVLAEAVRRKIEIGEAADLIVAPGQGLRGRVRLQGAEREVLAGTQRYVQASDEGTEPAATVIYVAWGGKTRGRLSFGNSIREEARQTVSDLQVNGVRATLLSGDREEVARSVGSQVGISDVRAPCSPDEKIEIIRAASGDGHTVAMIGDGINDAPALAAAAVGIALGAGTDLARQSGNVVLLSNRLGQVAWLIRLSQATRRIIRQNLMWAFGYNAIALAAAAAGVLHPLLAAVAMAVSSITLLSNSLRLTRFPE